MKRLKTFILSAVMALSMLTPAMAVNRVQWPMDVQPPSSWLNMMSKDSEYGFGQLIWDFLGRSNNGMIYTNLTVQAQSGLYVQVAPSVNNTIGSLYSIYSADLNPFGTGTQQLAADPVQLFHHGMLFSATSAIGPLNAPGTSGQSTAYTIECQTQTQDITPQTVNFVSSTNVASSGVADRDRADIIVCQATTGVTGTSPTAPAADTGWLKVGAVTVPYGTATITSGMIAQGTPFNGFLPNGSASTFMDLSTNQTAAGNKTFTGLTAFNNLLEFANSTETIPNLPSIMSDWQTSPGLLFEAASGSAGFGFYVNGVKKANIDNGGFYWAGSSNFGPTSAKVNGTITVGSVNGTFDGSTLTAGGTNNLALNSGSSVFVHYNDAHSIFRVYDGGTANYAALLSSGLSFSGASTSSYTSTDATVYGNLAMPNQAAGQCAQFDASHHIVAAGGACGLASGSITSVTGTAPITASTTGGAVTIGISATPSFTNATLGGSTTGGTLFLGTDGLLGLTRSGSALTFSGSAGASATVEADGGFITGTGTPSYYYPTYANVNGPVTATQFNGSGAGLTSATVPNAALVTPALTALTCSLNVACGTGTTPTVQLVSAPSFSGAVTASQFNGSGAGLTSATVPNAALVTPALTALTCSSNIVCGTGTTPTVQVTNAPTFTGEVSGGGFSTNGTIDLMGGSGANSDATIGRDGGATQGINFNVPTGSTYGYRFLVNGSPMAQIDATGKYTVGSTYLGATGLNLNGTMSYPSAGTATSTQDYGNTGGITFNGSKWTSGAATARSETLNFRVGDGSFAGIAVTGLADTNNTSFAIEGTRPTLNFNSLNQSTAQWSIIEGDTGGFTSGNLVFFDRTNSAQMMTLSPTQVYFGNGTSCGTTGGGSCITASGATFGGNIQSTNGVYAAPAGSGLQLCPNNHCSFQLSAANAPYLTFDGVQEIGNSAYASAQNGDLAIARDSAPTTGVIYLGSGGSHYLYFDGTNYQLPGGTVIAPSFQNSSRRALKHDISSIEGLDALSLLEQTHFVSFKYKKGLQDTHYGYIADDTPALLAGPKHDHFDAETVSTVDALAIKQVVKRLQVLESRQAMGQGIIVNGTTHDPRVDALQKQVALLWAGLILVGFLALGTLLGLILAVKYIVSVL